MEREDCGPEEATEDTFAVVIVNGDVLWGFAETPAQLTALVKAAEHAKLPVLIFTRAITQRRRDEVQAVRDEMASMGDPMPDHIYDEEGNEL